MKRVYRSIAVIASLAAIGVGPQCVVGESSSSKISSRFSASLERADEKISNNNNVDSSTPAFLSEENNDIDAETVVDPSHQRRELAWWNVVLQVVHLPCPPHCHENPNAHPCPHHCHEGGSSGGGGGGGGGGSGGDGSNSGGTTQISHNDLAPGSLAFWMLIAAASTMAVAIGAMIIGSRRKAKENYHPLKGSLDRRMKLFGGIAEGCFEDRELCGAQQYEDGMEMEGGGSQPAGYQEMV